MWIFTIIPSWLLPLTFFIGIVVLLVAKTLKVLPQAKLFEYISIAVIFFTVYMFGGQWVNDSWTKKAQALQQQVLELEVKSQQENTKIVEKIVTKRDTIRERGKDIIQYVDRVVVKDNEVIKYVEHCPKVPNEILNTINKAATP